MFMYIIVMNIHYLCLWDYGEIKIILPELIIFYMYALFLQSRYNGTVSIKTVLVMTSFVKLPAIYSNREIKVQQRKKKKKKDIMEV